MTHNSYQYKPHQHKPYQHNYINIYHININHINICLCTYSSIPLQDQGLLVIGIPLLQFQEREVVDLKVHPLLPFYNNFKVNTQKHPIAFK